MKKAKSKSKPVVTLVESKPLDKPVGIKSPWKEMGGLPTTEQLALIAATLARSTQEKPHELTKAAMALWKEARDEIFYTDFQHEIELQDVSYEIRLDEYYDFSEPPLFIPGEEPYPRDYFLRTVLPKYRNRADKLAQIAKAFVRDTLRERAGKEPSQDEINDAYGKWKPFENANHANAMAERFEQWYAWYVKQARRAAGKKSGEKATERAAARAKKTRKARPPREKLKAVVKSIEENL